MMRRLVVGIGALVVSAGAIAASSPPGVADAAAAAPQMADAHAEATLANLIQHGQRDAALQRLAAGADPNVAQADGTTALHWAAYSVDSGLVKALLAHGARADVRNRFGSTPLAEAVKVADVASVRMLLNAGADVESANQDGQTALMLAAHTGVVKVAELLVKHGANVNARERWRGQTALMWAAAEDRPGMTQFLVAHGAKVNTRAFINEWPTQVTSEPRAQYRPTAGLTPLLYATRSGCMGCVQALLKAGADINKPDPDGITPLISAIDNFNFDTARYLLEKGANPGTWDWWGRTPLYVAVDMNSYRPRFEEPKEHPDKTTAMDIVHMLLAAGVSPNPQLDMLRPGRGGNSGRFVDALLTTGTTPLLRAAISDDTEAIEVLLKAGALVDLPNAMGVTPLMASAGMGVRGGPGVTVPDTRGNYAGDVQSRAIKSLQVLLEAGADINARVCDTAGHTARIARPSTMTDRQGETALYGSISWGWTRVVQFLLANGARADLVDVTGATPLDAATKGHAGERNFKVVPEIAELLKKADSARRASAGSARGAVPTASLQPPRQTRTADSGPSR